MMWRENLKRKHCKRESTEAWHGGGNFRSSEEVLVMRMERREVVIRFLIMDENWRKFQEVRKWVKQNRSESSNEWDESNKMVAWHKSAQARYVCSLVTTRLEANGWITGAEWRESVTFRSNRISGCNTRVYLPKAISCQPSAFSQNVFVLNCRLTADGNSW